MNKNSSGNKTANAEIRNRLAENCIYHYEVAERLGIHESTLTVWLRKELDKERMERVNTCIDDIIRSRKAK